MAIKCKYTSNSGIELTDAYVNIPHMNISKDILFGANRFVASMTAHIYANESAYRNSKTCVDMYSTKFEIDDTNVIKKAYEVLKQDTIFSNIEDC